MRHSIRTRLLVFLIALIVIPQVLIGLVVGVQTFHTQSQQALLFQDQTADNEVNQLSDFFKGQQTQLQIVADEDQLRSATSAQKQIILSGVISQQDAFDQIFLLDGSGQEQVGVSRNFAIAPSDLVSRAQANEFKIPVAQNKVYYSPVHTNPTTGEPVITIAIPIENLASGTVDSVLVADLRFSTVQSLILGNNPVNVQTGNHSSIYMVDSANRVIAHNDPSVALRGLTFVPPAQDGIQNGLSGTSAALATSGFSLGDQTFTVVAETPASEALASATSTALFAAILTLVALVFAIAIVLGIVNRLVKPIVSLAATAQTIQLGDFSARASVTGKDEIGRLAQAFNSMTAQLQQTLQGLQDHVEDLEKARVEREKLVKDLQAAKRLAEENSRLKSEFLSTMSHELRTPLNAMEGFMGIILNRIGGTDFNKATEDLLIRARANGKRLLQLINDFLDLSRVEAGRLELANQPFFPERLANRWRDEISVLAEKKGLQFQVSLDSTLPETVYGDEEAISKIALNLLGNAIKFTEQGQVKLAMERSNDNWDITVEDTGIGIPPHAREFIFEEFRQVDQTSKRKYGGTGLGLAIVQKYARAMGGNVTVKSELGKGSTFTVSLPLKTTA